jgi:uncharacterized protein (DUF1501 family)
LPFSAEGDLIMRRREFLRSAIGATLAGRVLAGSSSLALLAPAARAQGIGGDYKALVMVFLYGGNDSFNLLVPRDPAGHAEYAAARSAIALPQAQLLPITPRTPDGRQYGLHPSTPELQDLFAREQLAFVANVGPLLYPVTRPQFLERSVPLPPQLFSHNDQQPLWQVDAADARDRRGWGGRLADLVLAGGDPKTPLSLSLAGTNEFHNGQRAMPFQLGAQGPIPLEGFDEGGPRRRQAFDAVRGAAYPSLLVDEYAGIERKALRFNERVADALRDAPQIPVSFPPGALGAQLAMVARLLSVRARFGVSRQTFFVAQGGYDTHDRELDDHPRLLRELARALDAFQRATEFLGLGAQVTTFTASDFGRSLTSNGDGTDHGWGGHQLVVGGAVRGGDIYGAMPSLVLGGADDCADTGLIIPKRSADEYGATLARWFGIGEAELRLVFPNLDRFERPDLGFMR